MTKNIEIQNEIMENQIEKQNIGLSVDIDIEVNWVQVQHPSITTINPEKDKEAFFPKTLYHPIQMSPIPLDCIEKMYS